jgi:hypothetical protein
VNLLTRLDHHRVGRSPRSPVRRVESVPEHLSSDPAAGRRKPTLPALTLEPPSWAGCHEEVKTGRPPRCLLNLQGRIGAGLAGRGQHRRPTLTSSVDRLLGLATLDIAKVRLYGFRVGKASTEGEELCQALFGCSAWRDRCVVMRRRLLQARRRHSRIDLASTACCARRDTCARGRAAIASRH